jgi:LysM repeat protein
VYQIARKYNVSPRQVLLLNPNASDLIQIGQELIIPEPKFTINKPTAGTNDFEYYLVVQGDTKFELAQRLSVSISQLESLNPQMVPMLLADSQIRVPLTKEESSLSGLEGLKTHLVARGETLYGIAKMYGITLDELIDANTTRLGSVLLAGQYLEIPELSAATKNSFGATYLVVKGDTKYGLSKRFNVDIASLERVNPSIVPVLMAGDRIHIPDDNTLANTDPPERQKTPEAATSEIPETPKNITETETNKPESSQQELTVASENLDVNPTKIDILLSFTENEYESFQNKKIPASASSLPLTTQQEEMLNYEGVIKAIDSLTDLQYDVKVNTFFAVNDSIMTAQNLYAPNKLILAPDLNLVLSNIKDPSARSIVVTNNYSDSKRSIASPVFLSRDSGNSSKDFLLNYLKVNDNNLILVSDPTQLNYLASAKANDKNLKFLTESNTIRIDEAQLESLLSKNQKNFVIFNTNRNGVFINVTNALLKLSAKYDVQTAIVNESFLPDEQNVSTTRFRILKMIYPQALDSTLDLSDVEEESSRIRLVNQGATTAYDLIRKLRNFDSNGGDVLTILKGDQMEQIQYYKMSNNRFKTGNFTISQY